MALHELSRGAVVDAIAEFDRLGEDEFLKVCGFGRARAYMLEREGRSYPSKAIAGVAHRYLGPGFPQLRSNEFSGGEATVAGILRQLGFHARKAATDPTARRNPNWTQDELILALEVYLRDPASPPGPTSAAVVELSRLLNELARMLGIGGADDFRNASGVYMKIMNFRSLDPAFASAGLCAPGRMVGRLAIADLRYQSSARSDHEF